MLIAPIFLPRAHAQADPPAELPAEHPALPAAAPDVLPKLKVTDAERSAIRISAYDLEVHLIPAEAREEVRATLTLRNTSGGPLERIPLQISGSLRWQRITTSTPTGITPIAFTQSPVANDADHTGFAEEAILTPAAPLPAGATLVVSVFYNGEIKQSGARLELLGTSPDRAAQTDWDAIVPTIDAAASSIRGFGNVLWYPVAAPAAEFGDGNKLFALIAQQRSSNAAVTMSLRLTVEYVGDPPDSAIFDGRLQPLTRTPDLDTQLVEETHGVATATFPATPIGFQIPSLFLTAQHAASSPDQLLSVITSNPERAVPYTDAAKTIAPFETAWLGPTPTESLLLLDHKGEPFADGGFLAAQLAADARPDDIAPSLVGPLTQAWLRSQHVWISEGFAVFLRLLWTEQKQGRAAALGELTAAASAIALAEPDLSASPADPGQPLLSASSDVYVQQKAAFVWWQLRELVGEGVLQQALISYRHSQLLNPAFDADPKALQKTLERVANTDLQWFFDDWVYHDHGLPDLTIVQVNPRLLPARPGKNAGYLVAVEVRNDGDAIADVPVFVSSDVHTSNARLRIPPHSSASTRVLFEDTPQSVQVNDGSVPELRTTTHVLQVPKP